MYQVVYKKSSAKGLLKMPGKMQTRMARALKEVAADPRDYQGDWKRLKGSPYWRLRVGSYRAICDIQEEKLVLLALKIGPRGDVYK